MFRRWARLGRGPTASQPILDPGNLLIVQERERLLARVFRKAGHRTLAELRIFEAGSGGGYNLRQCVQWGANPADLAGIDIDAAAVDYSRAHSPNIRVHVGSAERIPEPDRSFDVCLAFTLFSSVSDEDVAERIAAEMFRLTRPGGLIIVYDMRRDSPRNPSVHAIGGDDIRRWFPKCRVRTRHLTLVPPLARPLGRLAPFLYGPLALVPLARTHSLHVMRRPATSPFRDEAWTTSGQAGGANEGFPR
jgi:SAM-dependent methyltransferase